MPLLKMEKTITKSERGNSASAVQKQLKQQVFIVKKNQKKIHKLLDGHTLFFMVSLKNNCIFFY